jgi:transcriptional regulator with XRE-family HTH domain
MNFGEAIMDLRKRQRLKQKDLAKELNISATHLSLIEHGHQKPSVDLMSAIAQYFGLPITALLFKALDVKQVDNKEQRKYFKAAEPIVDALINYLISGESKTKGRKPEVRFKQRKRTIA